MSDRPEHPAAASSSPPEPGTPDEPAVTAASELPPPAAPPPAARYRELALGLVATLLLVVMLVGTAPFWAPLLPWGEARDEAAMTARIARLETAQQQIQQLQQQTAAASVALPRLEQRIGVLETKPAPMPPEFGEMRRQIATLVAGIADLTTRLERLESAGQAQTADLTAKLAALDRSVRAQQSAATELANRVQDIEQAGQSRASDMTDIGLALALLQIRNAVEAGRPFAAEFAAFSALANARPEIAAAAAPLAEPAITGTAGRAVLAKGLRELGPKIATARPAADAAVATGAERGWGDAVLDRLRGLVTIRRVEDARPHEEVAAALRAAERAIAGGDLSQAVGAVEKLQGAPAEAAAPWLRMARQRLAVEEALQRVEMLLTARLGDPAAAPGSPG